MNDLYIYDLKDYKYTNDLNEILNVLSKYCIFSLKECFEKDKKPSNFHEKAALNFGFEIIYTDDNHLCTYSEKLNEFSDVGVYLNKQFFNENREIIMKTIIDNMFSKFSVKISKEIFNDEVFEKIFTTAAENIYLRDLDLTDEQLKRLKKSFKNIYIITNDKCNKISSLNIVNHYTLKELKNDQIVKVLDLDLNDEEIENLKYISEGSTIKMRSELLDIYDKNYYVNLYETTIKYLSVLRKENKNPKLILKIDENDLFNRYYLDKFQNYSNVYVEFDNEVISLLQYAELNTKLDVLINDIDSNLSPLETYFVAYDIVKNFKKYNENHENKQDARGLRYILDNEYMVCVGYSKLLKILLRKSNIESYRTNADLGVIKPDKEKLDYVGHTRVVVHIKDDKYNLDNYYIADPTWDNDLNQDRLNYALKTFDTMQMGNEMFFFKDIDSFLDIKSKEEYNEKMNYVLNKKIKYFNEEYCEYSNLTNIYRAFKDQTEEILEVISNLDYNLYEMLNKQFEDILLSIKDERVASNETIKVALSKFEDIYGILGEECLKKTNKKININSFKQILKAIGKKKNNKALISNYLKNEEEKYDYPYIEYESKTK